MNIIITGASSGIGFETALKLLAEKHKVLALARNVKGLESLQAKAMRMNLSSSLLVYPVDITKPSQREVLLSFIRDEMKTVDVLINNAGILINKPFQQITDIELEDVYKTNFFAPFLLISSMISLFSKPGAHVVNIGSMGGLNGTAKFSGLSAYSSSKGALAVLSEVLAEELKDFGISVNCLALGAAQTEMLNAAFPGYKAPLTAEEMSEFIAWFAAKGQKFFNGKVLPVAVSVP